MAQTETTHVIDNDSEARSSIKRLLESENLEFRGYQTVAEFISNPQRDDPGCILIDLNLPGIDGADVFGLFEHHCVRLPIIAMTGIGSVELAVDAMKRGAFDVIEKPYRSKVAIQRIRDAVAFDAVRRKERSAYGELCLRFERLTPRERDVLELIVMGLTNRAVGKELGLSPKTIEVHRAHIMQKTGVGSLAELVRLWCAVRKVPNVSRKADRTSHPRHHPDGADRVQRDSAM